MTVNSRYFTFIWVTLLMLLASYVRIHGSDIYHFHVDELMHMKIAQGTTLKQVLDYSLFEAHPPLGHILRHFWNMVSETTPWSRSLSLIFGLGLIPLYYLIGKKLGGELTGMCAATLIAFSHGCVIQSYVVRNYSMFSFFISAAFYYYLLWRDERTNSKWLAGYIFWAICAVLTHFSGIFAITIITCCELLRIFRNGRNMKEAVQWLIFNSPIGITAILTFIAWHGTLNPIENFVAHETSLDMPSYTTMIFILPPLYLIHVVDYIYIRPAFIYVLALLIPITVSQEDESLPSLKLGACAFLMGVVLFITHIYPFAGDRHGLWLLPFLIPPAAWMLANTFEKAVKKPYITAILVLMCGALSYDATERFTDSLEYKITENDWHDISGYLNSLDQKTLLFTGKTDAIMLAPHSINIYSAIRNPANAVSPLSDVIPYYNTHLLFDKTYRMYTENIIKIFEDAYTNHTTDPYDGLVFVSTFVPSDIMADLILCPQLDKKLISFPAAKPSHVFVHDDLRKFDMIFMEVEKQTFYKQFVAPDGVARQCLRKQKV